jgi:hypothetical protein
MPSNDDYSGGPSLRGIRRSYKTAAKKGNAVPADERSGSVLNGDVYSDRKEYRKQGAAATGMSEGFSDSKRYNAKDDAATAKSLAKRDRSLSDELTKRGAGRLTVWGRKKSDLKPSAKKRQQRR